LVASDAPIQGQLVIRPINSARSSRSSDVASSSDGNGLRAGLIARKWVTTDVTVNVYRMTDGILLADRGQPPHP
jgi:hypothetical protein